MKENDQVEDIESFLNYEEYVPNPLAANVPYYMGACPNQHK